MAPRDDSPARRGPSRQPVGLAVALAGAMLIAACARQPEAVVPADPTATEPTGDVEAAAAAFDEAEDSLQRLMVSSTVEAGPRGEETDVDDDLALAGPLAEREAARQRTSRCTRACRALASMERSAERLCELTDEQDARCRSARRRLESARDLVQRSCTECVDDG